MRTTLKPVKFTTRELRITRQMTAFEFVRSVRGAAAEIARELGVTHPAVASVLRGQKKSKRVEQAIDRWVRKEIQRRAA